jgi:hypothetical protein
VASWASFGGSWAPLVDKMRTERVKSKLPTERDMDLNVFLNRVVKSGFLGALGGSLGGLGSSLGDLGRSLGTLGNYLGALGRSLGALGGSPGSFL